MREPAALATSATLLHAAQRGEPDAFDQLLVPYRPELLAHCYRMLGSLQDAEDALQETSLAAWRGIRTFAERSTLRAWLYRIATNACLRLIARRPRRIQSRIQSEDYGAPLITTDDLGTPVTEPIWLEPLPDEAIASDTSDPSAQYVRRESVELAYVAALQHLAATQRAVLILREVLEFSAADVARMLDTTPTSVNSALQRARRKLKLHSPMSSQQSELAMLGADKERALVDAFVSAWERADVPALLDLLVEDATFSMPPLPAWFDGRDAVRRFLVERMFATPWRLVPMRVNAQLAFACYQAQPDMRFKIGAINVLGLRTGRIAEIRAFLDPALYSHFNLAEFWPENSLQRQR
jgi:RNA polymerase sigma-70 factor (ECF subfamily)